MSDYKSLRIKKSNELEAAICSVPKDLYQWNNPVESKQSSVQNRTNEIMSPKTSSVSSISSPFTSARRQAPSFPAPPTRVKPLQSTLKLKRPNSLRDFEKSVPSNRLRQLSSAQPNAAAAAGSNEFNSNFDLLIVEDLSDSSWSDFNTRPKSMANTDRPYLSTGRRKSPGPASFREVSDREAELVKII